MKFSCSIVVVKYIIGFCRITPYSAKTDKFRPAPRGPEFLMESLQREGLDEHIEFSSIGDRQSTPYSTKNLPSNSRLSASLDLPDYSDTGKMPCIFKTPSSHKVHFHPSVITTTPSPPVKSVVPNTQMPIDNNFQDKNSYHTNTFPKLDNYEQPSNLVLMPPSAFMLPNLSQDDHHAESDGEISQDNESTESACSSSDLIFPISALPALPTDPLEGKDTFKTFVVQGPPQSNNGFVISIEEELKEIKKEMREYQQLKEDLRYSS